jgi:hypothetical protein
MPATLMAAPEIHSGFPSVQRIGSLLLVTLPIFNLGDDTATSFTLTGVSVGSLVRTEPALPHVLGNLAPYNHMYVAAAFAAPTIVTGGTGTFQANGTYTASDGTHTFAFSWPITYPAPIAQQKPLLAARISVAVSPGTRTWSYSVVNQEPAGSPRNVNSFSIDMVGPFTVTGTPSGWTVTTDNLTYVFWSTTRASSDVGPSRSKDGFRIQSQSSTTSEGRGYVMTSVNATSGQKELLAFGSVLVPAR